MHSHTWDSPLWRRPNSMWARPTNKARKSSTHSRKNINVNPVSVANVKHKKQTAVCIISLEWSGAIKKKKQDIKILSTIVSIRGLHLRIIVSAMSGASHGKITAGLRLQGLLRGDVKIMARVAGCC